MNYTLKNFTITGLVACAVVLGPVSSVSAAISGGTNSPWKVTDTWKSCAKTNYVKFVGGMNKRTQSKAHHKAKRMLKRGAKYMCEKKCGPTKTAKGFKMTKKGTLYQYGNKNQYWGIKKSAPKTLAYECR